MNRSRVALILSDINAFRLIPGIHRMSAGSREYWMVDSYRPLEEIRNLIKQWKPQGLIVEWMPGITESLINLGIPTVITIGDYYGGGVPSIDVDDARVGALAAIHLQSLGLTQFAFVGEATAYSRQREHAFRIAVTANGHSCSSLFQTPRTTRKYIEHWHESEPELQEWLRALPKPVGIFAAHDPSGRLLAETCREIEIRIPEEVAIIGANNDTHVCGMTYPPLSSIEIPWETIGYETAVLMEQVLEGHSPFGAGPLLIPPSRVVPRRSSDFLSVSNPQLSRALEFIHENACTGIMVDEVVRGSLTSRRRLERAFRDTLGLSIHDAIIRTRLVHAKSLLIRPDLSIEQIAEYCGFSRNERFTVNFRKYEGITPRDYRRKIRGDEGGKGMLRP